MDDHRDRLARGERVADARARIYGRELNTLCDVADKIANGAIPTSAIREITARMVGDDTPEPASLDAHRARRNGGAS